MIRNRAAEVSADLARREDAATELDRAWSRHSGLFGWICSTDHKDIGRRFLATALGFFVAGGVLATLMRLQLARPNNDLLGPDLYDQVFTMHGTTMMFLFAIPVMEAMGIYLVPLMIGARNVAFPRLAAFSYWIFLCGGLSLFVFFLLDVGPDAGWFAYVPLSGPEYSPGKRVDIWSQLINFTEIAALGTSVDIIVTVFKMRAPGMTMMRLPIFVWGQLVTAFMVVFAMPAVMTCSLFLTTDRLVGTHFYNPAEGGDPLLWQHMFWFFAHPEVYIIFLPATGFVSAMLPAFTRRPVFGYPALVLALASIALLGFGLWVHHMFATGLPRLGTTFFSATTMLIALPSGVQVFCWIATIWSGRPLLRTPMLFILGFIVLFVFGGMTGVLQAAEPVDLQVHDSYFVVAHFHYVLIGGSLFPLFGALHFWLPKITGRLYSERAGGIAFALLFVGFHLTFFPMHILGLEGMPRRVYTYMADAGWATGNAVATFGFFVLAAGMLVTATNLLVGMLRGKPAGNDPWFADTLEWSVPSPPPSFNFLELPVVSSRSPMWEPDPRKVRGIRTNCREVLLTQVGDARPDSVLNLPSHSIWPLCLALAATVTFLLACFTPWSVVIGALLVFVTLVGWALPDEIENDCTPARVDTLDDAERLRIAEAAQ